MAKQFTLSKSERLKSRKQIEFLFNGGKSFVNFPYKVFYHFKSPGLQPGRQQINSRLQFGTGAGTRHFKKAVDRNRIKRLTREAFRLNKLDLLSILAQHNITLAIFFIYTGKEIPDYLLVKEKVVSCLNRLIKLANENSNANP